MAAMTGLQRTAQPRRVDPIAAAWGGLVGGIGLVVATPRELALRVLIVVVAGILAGFLTGMRAIRNRYANAVAAWVAANVFYAGFIAAATLVHVVDGQRAAPAFDPGGIRRWLVITAIGLGATLAGGAIANLLLRPAGRRSNYS